MKDGMNSANRYYLNQFRDSFRQTTVDLLLGNDINQEQLTKSIDCEDETKEEKEEDSEEEHIKSLIEDCKKLLIPNLDLVVGSWGLIDNDPATGDPRQEDMDIIFILTTEAYYVANYDETQDKVTDYQTVLLKDVEKIEFGIPERDAFKLANFRNKHKDDHVLRIIYKFLNPEKGEFESGFIHSFRSTNLRFFNNMAVKATSEDERIESLKAIADSIGVTVELNCQIIPDMYFGKLDKSRSKIPPRYTGNAQESSIKSTLSNVGSQLSKFNPMKLRKSKENSPPPANSEFQALHAKLGNQFNINPTSNSQNNSENKNIISFLTPDSMLNRKLSKSSSDVSSNEESRQPPRTSSHKNLPFVVDLAEGAAVEVAEATEKIVLSPFAKITKGIQNIGASLGPGNKNLLSPISPMNETLNTPMDNSVPEIPPSNSNPSTDYMHSKLAENTSKTKFTLL